MRKRGSMRQVWHRNATRLHKWIALIVGVQLFLWTASGLFMTIFPIEEVRGEHLVRTESPLLLDEPFVMPVFDREPVIGLALRQIDGRPVLVVEHPTRRMMHDPYTGAHIMSPDATGIRERAARVYKGSGEIEAVTLIESDPPGEYRGRLPVWQVQFDDGDALRLYLDPATGEVITRRTRLWRVYDFMWMLHIMDYDSRDDFNNPLVQVAAGLGLSVALSGLLLLFYRVLKPDRRRISRTA